MTWRQTAALMMLSLVGLVLMLVFPPSGRSAVVGGVLSGAAIPLLWLAAEMRQWRLHRQDLEERFDDLAARFRVLSDRYVILAQSARRLAGKRGLN